MFDYAIQVNSYSGNSTLDDILHRYVKIFSTEYT